MKNDLQSRAMKRWDKDDDKDDEYVDDDKGDDDDGDDGNDGDSGLRRSGMSGLA